MREIFQPLDPVHWNDPYPEYQRLREGHPVVWATTPVPGYFGFWFLSRHQDVMAGLKNERFGREIMRILPPGTLPSQSAQDDPLYRLVTDWMLLRDPPDHGRMRRVAAPVFAARSILEMKDAVAARVRRGLAEIPLRAEVDVIADFATPMALGVISDLLGIPETDRDLIRIWVRDITLALDLVRSQDRVTVGSGRAAEIDRYFRDLVRGFKGDPDRTLLGLLIAASRDQNRLSEDEVVASCVLFLFAGHETSHLFIGNSLLALAGAPDQYRNLRDGAVDPRVAALELLRFDSPQQLAFRHAFEDVELHGVRIRKGQTVCFGLGAANRDPAAFDNPERLDLARNPARQIAFGAGIHTCIGAGLALLEAETVLSELPRLFPRVEVVTRERQESVIVRGLSKLVLRLDG